MLLILNGCGGGPDVVPVAGVLTYKGKPVPNVIVDFMPAGGRPSWGKTDAQGRFQLEYDDKHKGALIGKHKVSARMPPHSELEKVPGERPIVSSEMGTFLEKYNMDLTKIEVVIDRNTKEVNLTWD